MLSSQASSVMPATVTSLPNGDQLPKSAQNNQATNAQLNENNFFQLLTAQLENQDPLNPMSASDFAAELAQFSTATGVQSLNATITAASGIQAAGLVGRNVAVTGVHARRITRRAQHAGTAVLQDEGGDLSIASGGGEHAGLRRVQAAHRTRAIVRPSMCTRRGCGAVSTAGDDPSITATARTAAARMTARRLLS